MISPKIFNTFSILFSIFLRFAKKHKLIFKRIIQIVLVGTIFFFLARNLYQNWNDLSSYNLKINYYLMTFSFCLALVNPFFFSIGWNIILGQYGASIGLTKSFKILFLSNLGKYLPGKVWLFLGNAYLCGKEGISAGQSSASIATQVVLQTSSGLAIFFTTLIFWPKILSSKSYLLFIVIIPIGLISLHPSVMNKILNFVLRKMRKEPIIISLRYQTILLLFLFWCGLWILSGISQYLLLCSIYRIPIERLPVLIGVHSFSSIAGFLSILAPAGLGVTEGVATGLLSFYFPVTISTIYVLLSRVLRTLADIIYAFIAYRL